MIGFSKRATKIGLCVLAFLSMSAAPAGSRTVVGDVALTVGLLSDVLRPVATIGFIAIAAGVAWAYRRRWRQAMAHIRRLEWEGACSAASTAGAPTAVFVWRPGDAVGQGRASRRAIRLAPACPSPKSGPAVDDNGEVSYRTFRHGLSADSATALDGAISALRQSGRPFDLSLDARDGDSALGGRLRAAGRRADASGCDMVLMFAEDEHAECDRLARRADTAAHRADDLRAILDALPIPVWRRADDLSIDYCNAAYRRAIDGDLPGTADDQPGDDEPVADFAVPERELAQSTIRPGSDGAPGRSIAERAWIMERPQTEIHHAVMSGSRRFLELTEAPVGKGGRKRLVGFATDRTVEKEFSDALTRHVGAHGDVLHLLGSAIEIYGADRRLKFYNIAHVGLIGLDEHFLAGDPTIGEMLDEKRARGRLPETLDFAGVKREWEERFQQLMEPSHDLLHLPDGVTTLRQTIAPHPLGGLIVLYEDVSDRMQLERRYNALRDVQGETLHHLFEAVGVFDSGDGRLKLSNPVFQKLWGVAPDLLTREPHLQDIVVRAERLFPTEPRDGGLTRTEFSQWLRSAVFMRRRDRGRMARIDGTVLEYMSIPLPDGKVLLSFFDVTKLVEAQQDLQERADALEKEGQRRTEFIANLSATLSRPLRSIRGAADTLANQYLGPLETRQQTYARNLADGAGKLISLISDIEDAAMMQAGRRQLLLGPISLERVVDAAVRTAGNRLGRPEFSVAIDRRDSVGDILADERRISRAMAALFCELADESSGRAGGIKLTIGRTVENIGSISAERCASIELCGSVRPTGPSPFRLQAGAPKPDGSNGSLRDAPERRDLPPPTVEAGGRIAEAGAPPTGRRGIDIALWIFHSTTQQHGGQLRVVEEDSENGSRIIVRCLLPLRSGITMPLALPSPDFPGMTGSKLRIHNEG